MKSRLKRNLNLLLLQIGMIIITISSSFLYYGNLTISGLSTTPEVIDDVSMPAYSVPVSDCYGINGLSLDQFLNRKGVLSDLFNINKALNQSENFVYYQLIEPSVYFVGPYKGEPSSIVGGEEYRNQVDMETGEFVTSLNCMEISENLSEQIQKQVTEGKSFSEGDFSLTYEDSIPVVLGHEYRKILSIGDTLKLRYYLEEIDVRIIGFLDEDSTITLPSIYSEVGGYMILPDIKIPEENFKREQKNDIIMMLEKCEGYLGVNKTDNFSSAIDEIKNISEKYNFAINIEAIKSSFAYFEEQSEKQVIADNKVPEEGELINIDNHFSVLQNIILCGLIILGVICILISIRRWDEKRSVCLKNERAVLVKTKTAITFSLHIICAYIVAYIICRIIFSQIYGGFDSNFISYPQSWVRLFLLGIIIIGNIFLCRRIERKLKGGSGNG